MGKRFERVHDGFALPADVYLKEKYFNIEQDQIFQSTWQYAGPAAWVLSPGDFFATEIGTVPILVVRNKYEQIKAFLNVCRHRSATLKAGKGNCRLLTCPYHAWSYDLNGNLVSAPSSVDADDLNFNELSLSKLRVEQWGPMIFVTLSESIEALEETLGDLPDLYENVGLDMQSLGWRTRREYTMNANWKVGTENILECYHCPIVHPNYAAVLAMDAYEYSTTPFYALQRTRLDSTVGLGVGAGYDTNGIVKDALYGFVWPNFMANTNPGPGMFHTNNSRAIDLKTMVMVNDFFFSDDVSEEESNRYVDFQDQVSMEDIPPVESVQKGLDARIAPQGRLLESQESHIKYFMEKVSDVLQLENA